MKNLQKGSAIKILIVVVLVVLVGVVGWRFFTEKASNSGTSSTNTDSQPEKTTASTDSQPKPTVSENTDPNVLSTYSNSKYGFSFKYPKGYVTADGKPNSATVGFWFVWLYDRNQNTIVSVNVYQTESTLDQFIANEKQTLSGAESTVSFEKDGQISVGNNMAMRVKYVTSGRSAGTYEIYYIKKNGLVYRLQLNPNLDNGANQTMLSTFTVKQNSSVVCFSVCK